MKVAALVECRRRKGFALYWWWRVWTALGFLAYDVGIPAGLCNALGRIGQLR